MGCSSVHYYCGTLQKTKTYNLLSLIMAKQKLTQNKSAQIIDISTGELIQQESKEGRSRLNFEWKKSKKESGIDMTIPDQSMTLRDIVTKHSHGMEIGGVKTAIFDEAERAEGINPWTLDLVDLQELKILNNEEIISLQNRAIAEKEERKQKAIDARAAQQLEAEEKAIAAFEKRIKATAI